ncbi:MAG: hypothetical protein V4696_00410 [Pseudomonadota bacterium]
MVNGKQTGKGPGYFEPQEPLLRLLCQNDAVMIDVLRDAQFEGSYTPGKLASLMRWFGFSVAKSQVVRNGSWEWDEMPLIVRSVPSRWSSETAAALASSQYAGLRALCARSKDGICSPAEIEDVLLVGQDNAFMHSYVK